MRFFLGILFLFISLSLKSQVDMKFSNGQKENIISLYSLEKDVRKLNILLISEGISYCVTLVGLNSLWYKDYPRTSFHFINDNGEWNQMDKIGHLTTAYYIGVIGIKAYSWAGLKEKKAIWFGGLSGSIFLSAIEVLDGFSAEWGASSSDFLANTLGSALCISQALLWNNQKIQLKYSYQKSYLADINPEQLGKNVMQNILKDYNGQSYWLSFNLKSLLELKSNFPNWLSLSFGYGAYGMENPYHKPGDPVRGRQYFLSFDIDLNRIKTKSNLLNSALHTFGFIKFPMPTLELKENKVTFHSLYF